jgi:hypothetical protein
MMADAAMPVFVKRPFAGFLDPSATLRHRRNATTVDNNVSDVNAYAEKRDRSSQRFFSRSIPEPASRRLRRQQRS